MELWRSKYTIIIIIEILEAFKSIFYLYKRIKTKIKRVKKQTDSYIQLQLIYIHTKFLLLVYLLWFISTIGFVNQWEHLGRQITNIYQFILIQNILLQNLTVWLFAGRKVWDQKLKQILCERHLAAKLVTNDSSLSVVSDRSRLQLTSAFKCLRKSSPLFLNFNKQTWQTDQCDQ